MQYQVRYYHRIIQFRWRRFHRRSSCQYGLFGVIGSLLSHGHIAYGIIGLFLTISAGVIGAVPAANAAMLDYDGCRVDEQRLLRGDLLACERAISVFNRKPQGDVAGVILVNAPYSTVWRVLSNWEAQSGFVPGIKYYRVIHKFSGGNRSAWHALIEGRLLVPFVAGRYTLDAHFDQRIGRVSWNMLTKDDAARYQAEGIQVKSFGEEQLKRLEGVARIVAYDTKRTVFYYAPVLEPATPTPDFIRGAVRSVVLDDYMLAIKQAAEKRAK
ncbi:hypothetical protein HDN1F_02050 [gamma proteobacterium HdN1]|nr:hypothetical protein HDN1F_02050 [gamma proteobacterium HdN1]